MAYSFVTARRQPLLPAKNHVTVQRDGNVGEAGEIQGDGNVGQCKAEAVQYWKLNAMRTNFFDELSIFSASSDFLRFVLWTLLGFLLDIGISKLGKDNNIWYALRSIELIFEVLFALFAFTYKIWPFLEICVGAGCSLLVQDLLISRHWRSCEDESFRIAYVCIQMFAAVLGPVAACNFVLTSLALDRTFGIRSATGFESYMDWFEPPYFLKFNIIPKKSQEEAPLCGVFQETCRSWKSWRERRRPEKGSDCSQIAGFQKLRLEDVCDCQESENSTSESDRESSREEDPESRWSCLDGPKRCARKVFCPKKEKKTDAPSTWNGALIYCERGQHHEFTGHEAEIDKDDWDTLVSHHHDGSKPLLYFKYGDRKEEPALLYLNSPNCLSDDCTHCTDRLCSPFVLLLVALLLVLTIVPTMFAWRSNTLMDIWSNGALFFLIVPDFTATLLKNETHELSNTFSNETLKRAHDIVDDSLVKGKICLFSGNEQHAFSARLAISASSFYLVACIAIILAYCVHLSTAAKSLHALNDLLDLHLCEGKHCHAMLLYKLHHIRQSISNKRCLECLALRSLPNSLAQDDSFCWWFETRAALFGDILFNLEKRKPILHIFVIAEMVLIVLTTFTALFHSNHLLTCFTSIFGIGMGGVALLFFIFGSRVNSELAAGAEKAGTVAKMIESGQSCIELGDEEKASPSASPKSRASPQGSPLRSPMDKSLHYEAQYPAKLRFFGYAFSMDGVYLYAGPFLSMLGSIGFAWIKPAFKDLL